MRKVYKDRFLKLARLLEKDAKSRKGIKFDIDQWCTVSNQQKPISCGTTACAMGLAALSGKFPGLKAVPRNNWLGKTIYIAVVYKGETDFGAASKLFGIDETTADWIFNGNYKGKMTGATGELKVAKRIRDFVKGKALPPDTDGY